MKIDIVSTKICKAGHHILNQGIIAKYANRFIFCNE